MRIFLITDTFNILKDDTMNSKRNTLATYQTYRKVISYKKSFQVTLTSFNNPFCFYVQEDLKSFKDLNDKLQNFYTQKSLVLIKNPSVGKICAVKLSKDNAWYRAIIQNINQDQNMVEVFFVDNGNKEFITINEININICELNEEFKKHPVMGLKCSLKGIEKNLKNSSDFKSLALPETVSVYFIGNYQDSYYVDVNFEQKGENDDLIIINLNKYLIENRYVEFSNNNKLKHEMSTTENLNKNGKF